VKPANLTGDWALLANLHRPPDVTNAIRTLAAQGMKPPPIASTLHIGVTAVEQALREVQQ
jgi:hypothetical protein